MLYAANIYILSLLFKFIVLAALFRNKWKYIFRLEELFYGMKKLYVWLVEWKRFFFSLHHHSATPAIFEQFLEYVHFPLAALPQSKSFNWLLLFTHNFSRWWWVYFLAIRAMDRNNQANEGEAGRVVLMQLLIDRIKWCGENLIWKIVVCFHDASSHFPWNFRLALLWNVILSWLNVL